MIPTLYDKKTTDFTNNGKGKLVTTSKCIVTEGLNEDYEMGFECSINDPKFDLINGRDIVTCKVSDGSIQPFRIVGIHKSMNGKAKFRCQHISYDLCRLIIVPSNLVYGASGLTAARQWLIVTGQDPDLSATLQGEIAGGLPLHFSFWTDITQSAGSVFTPYQRFPRSVRSFLGGTGGADDDNFLNEYGGEFEWDVFTVKLHQHRGADNSVTIRYGKNLTGLDVDEDYNTVNAALPYSYMPQAVTKMHFASGNPDSGLTIGKYLVSRESSINDVDGIEVLQFDAQGTGGVGILPADIARRGLAWLDNNKPWNPIKTYKVKFSIPTETTATLNRVLLGDTVTIFHEKLGVNLKMRVVRTEYNSLLERYESVEIGKDEKKLTIKVDDNEQKISTSEKDANSNFQALAAGDYGYLKNVDPTSAFMNGKNIKGANLQGESFIDITNGSTTFKVDSSGVFVNGRQI